MGRDTFSSHSRYHPPKKRTTVSYQNPTLQTLSSPKKHPRTDTGEDPNHQKPSEITVEHAHKDLLPPCDEADHDTPLEHRLIGTYRYDTCMHLCPYTPHRSCHGWVEGKCSLTPVRVTILIICSPFPTLTVSFPPPFKFAQEPFCFFGHMSTWTSHVITSVDLLPHPLPICNLFEIFVSFKLNRYRQWSVLFFFF